MNHISVSLTNYHDRDRILSMQPNSEAEAFSVSLIVLHHSDHFVRVLEVISDD